MNCPVTRLGSGRASKDPRGRGGGRAEAVSQGKLDQLSRYGEREVGVFSWLAPGVLRRLAPTTKEVVQARFSTGCVGVVETALGPSVLSFCSL